MSAQARVSLHLQVHFTLPRDETIYHGVALSFGRGSLVFITFKDLTVKQPLRLSICRVEGGEEQFCRRVAAVVEGVKPEEGGRYTVTVSFVQEEILKEIPGDNRRRSPRYATELDGRFRQGNEKYWFPCIVQDLSRTGLCIEAARAIRELGSVEVVLLPRVNSPVGKMMVGSVFVVRSRHLGRSRYEIAGSFQKIESFAPLSPNAVEIRFPLK